MKSLVCTIDARHQHNAAPAPRSLSSSRALSHHAHRWWSRRARLARALFALVCLAPQLVRADFTVTSVLPEIGTGARAVDAHDSVAYVVDDGVTAVDVSDESAPRVIASLTDFDLSGCASVAAYAAANGQKRLAVACAGSNALVVVDANAPREGLRVLGAVQDDTALSGISSVVVKGTLAFVTAPGVQRVVSVDLAADASPRILSFEKLSGADAVSFAADNHIAVGSGYAHGGGRVTIMSYVPSGVMMKVGSIKDGRLGGELRDVRAFPADPAIAFAVTDAAGGSVLVVNATTRARPSLAVGLQAQGRAAATAPLSSRTRTSTPPPAGPPTATGVWRARTRSPWAGQDGVRGQRRRSLLPPDATDPSPSSRMSSPTPSSAGSPTCARRAGAPPAPLPSRPCPPRRAPSAGGVANRVPPCCTPSRPARTGCSCSATRWVRDRAQRRASARARAVVVRRRHASRAFVSLARVHILRK